MLTFSPSASIRLLLANSEMVSYRKDVTGIDHTVFTYPKGILGTVPRLKLAIAA
jgi:hypothetical protein